MICRVAAVGMLVAVLAGAATGADKAPFAPRLRAELVRSPDGGQAVVLDTSQTIAEPALARATFLVPADQRFRLPPPGEVVGDAAVALVPLAGGTPSLLSGPLVTGTASAGACVRHPTALVEAKLRAAAGAVRKLTLRFYVHERRGTRITVCLPPNTGRAARRLAIRLTRGLGAPPNGSSMWRGLYTPVGKRGGAAAYPTTTESRGIVVSPAFLTLQGPVSAAAGSRVTVHGLLSFGHLSHGRNVRIPARSVLVRARTGRSGAYRAQVKAPARGALVLQARVRSRRLGCGGRTIDAPAGCTSATLAGVSSNVLRVRVR
jgi:hypothetical protein